MKRIVKLSIGILSICSLYGCHTSYLMKKIEDVKNIEVKKDYFVNKPVIELLNRIKPAIKLVSVRSGWAEQAGYFVFKFVDSVEEKQYNKEGKLSPRIRVFVKESFEWDFEKRPKGKQFIWTKSDEERYGNLTIIDLITSGGVIK